MKELFERDSYLKPVDAIFNRQITEYDLKSANTSIAREFGLLPEEVIKEIEYLPKKERVICIGNIKRENSTYDNLEQHSFAIARSMFLSTNDIQDEDILTIKRDAIFVVGVPVKNEQITKNLTFRKKGVYTSYIHLSPLEVYYNPLLGLTVKGIRDDIYEMYHKEYFGNFLDKVFMRKEKEQDVLMFVRKFWDEYKWLQLESGYYREFNAQSRFRYRDGDTAMEEYMDNLKMLNIQYNHFKITELTKILLNHTK